MKAAITTDWLTSYGGGERVVEEILALYPAAPLFASVYHAPSVSDRIRAADVRTTWLQRFPMVRAYSRMLLPLMPRAFAGLDLRSYDIVISVTSAFAKHLSIPATARHVCYCHTPPRYLWDLEDEYLRDKPGRSLLSGVATALRATDQRGAQTVDHFVANSATVAERIRRAYGRESTVIYPPVHTDLFRPEQSPANDFYLVVSRLVGYKRIDLAVAACTRLGRRLVVLGDGPERARLERMAGPTVSFIGKRSDPEIARMYANCRALLFPGLDDFGITPVEVQSAGRPVIAFGRGGATETVVPDVTGLFFAEQTVDDLVDAIERFERAAFDPARCRENALRFDARVFRERFGDLIDSIVPADPSRNG